MHIDQKTALYGVVGYPLAHTLSPVMHNAAFLETHMNAVYLAFESQDIDGCLRGMKGLGIKGMSVTVPHKSEVIPLLDQVDDLALSIGAVNTIVNRGGVLKGYNTDAMGALKAIQEETDPAGKTCLIIGAGGAARAIAFILKKHGTNVNITNRSLTRGRALATALECPFIPLEEAGTIKADILIHATSVGMYPFHERCIVTPDMFQRGMIVMDIVYNPVQTRFLTLAAERGCKTIDGLGMLVYQGVEQFRLWTGLDAPVDAMTNALADAMRRFG